MKKTGIALLLLLAVMLTACGQTPQNNIGSTPATTTAVTTEPEETWATVAADRTITAQQYFVYSCESETFLNIAQDATTKIYPASVTKLFTAYVALQYVTPTQTVAAGDVLNMVAAGSSVAEIAKGDVLTVEQLVEAMLLPSGNDAAYLLAAHAGKAMAGEKADEQSTEKSVQRFVAEMNAQAKLLGMNDTNFANPDGIHSESHYTTYADLAIMGTLALEDPTIMKYARVSSAEIALQSGTKTWKNTNALIDPASPWYCPYATGLKTGQTPYAGSCLLSSFEYKGTTLLIGVFGCPTADDRFPDTLLLFQKTIAQ